MLFQFDPERAHDAAVSVGETLGCFGPGRWLVHQVCVFEHPALATTVAGIHFKNPIGLGAGFDKDARLTRIMPAVGFGFMEVGSVTRNPRAGNPKPRLQRLPRDHAIVVYYGLKNDGVDVIEGRLAGKPHVIPWCVSIAAVGGYEEVYRRLAPIADFVTINISCPNTDGGCEYQDPAMLAKLLRTLSQIPKPKPVFLKISSHLIAGEVDGILKEVERYTFVDGFIVGNLCKRRELLHLNDTPRIPGGISGGPIKDLSTKIIRHIYRRTRGEYAIVGLGGVSSAGDAYEKIRAGASLVEIVTGLIYGGPRIVRAINQGLVDLLARDGYGKIGEAVGTES